jgi:uncharacterized protein YqfA (UPF0365 family)
MASALGSTSLALSTFSAPRQLTWPIAMYLDAVKVSVNPKVIETPKVAAVANDGIQIIA